MRRIRAAAVALQGTSMEVFLALLCILAGLPIIFNPGVFAPASVLALLPICMVFVWGGALVLGGVLIIAGIVTGNMYLERAGLALVSMGSLIMGVSIALLTGYTRLFSVGVYLLFSWAMAARYFELGKVLSARRSRWREKIKED